MQSTEENLFAKKYPSDFNLHPNFFQTAVDLLFIALT